MERRGRPTACGWIDRSQERDTARSPNHGVERCAFLQHHGRLLTGHGHLELPAPELQLEGIALPCGGEHGVEMGAAVPDPEAPEAFDEAHPSARHARDVQALVGLVVVIVEVQAGGPQIHLYGLVFHAELGGEDGVYTRTQAALVHCPWLVKLEILAVGRPIEFVFEEIQSLQGVGLLDKDGPQDAVPAPVLVDGALSWIQIGGHLLLLVHEAVLLKKHLACRPTGGNACPGSPPPSGAAPGPLQKDHLLHCASSSAGACAFIQSRASQAWDRHQAASRLVYQLLLTLFSYSLGPVHAQDDPGFLVFRPVYPAAPRTWPHRAPPPSLLGPCSPRHQCTVCSCGWRRPWRHCGGSLQK